MGIGINMANRIYIPKWMLVIQVVENRSLTEICHILDISESHVSIIIKDLYLLKYISVDKTKKHKNKVLTIKGNKMSIMCKQLTDAILL